MSGRRGPKTTSRTRAMVEAYEAGATLAEVGQLYGVSKQRAHAVVKRHARSAMRPQTMTRFRSVGPKGQELYMVGQCKVCEAPLGSYRPIAQEFCGDCCKDKAPA